MRHLPGKTFEIKLIQVLGYDLVFAYVDQVSPLVLVWLFQKILVPPSQLGLHIRLLKKEKMYLITQGFANSLSIQEKNSENIYLTKYHEHE